jgi:hypothetical protein
MEFRTKFFGVTKRESTRRYARWVLEDRNWPEVKSGYAKARTGADVWDPS